MDDQAISKVGVWPWSRDVMADGLILMREFGAGYAVFDIEYLNPSPRGVDSFVLRNAVPDAFDQEFSQIQTNVQQLVDAIRTGSIPSRDIPKYLSDLDGLTAQSKGKLLDTVKSVERDNDTYLGQAARFFGHAFMTVAAPDLPDDSAAKETVDYAMANLALTNVTVRADPTRSAPSLVPAIVPILKGDAGAGFPNVVVDPDGVRRRIDLIKSYHGKYFAQLAFRPLLAWLGNPPIELDRRRILLRGATVPGKGKTDLSIPLTSDGQLLINWPHANYLDSFRHLTFYELVLHKNLESDLLYNLKLMNQSGYLSYDTGTFQLLDGYNYAEGIKKDVLAGGSLSQIDEYIQTRTAFFDAVGAFLNGDAETRILKDVDANLARKGLSAADRANVQAIRDQVPATFESTRGVYADLMKVRQVLSKDAARRILHHREHRYLHNGYRGQSFFRRVPECRDPRVRGQHDPAGPVPQRHPLVGEPDSGPRLRGVDHPGHGAPEPAALHDRGRRDRAARHRGLRGVLPGHRRSTWPPRLPSPPSF